MSIAQAYLPKAGSIDMIVFMQVCKQRLVARNMNIVSLSGWLLSR